ncbi:MAG: hypothetical protein KME13_19960 [Myxacorys californica WJT36-NPBG1]|nr:hypothetical protein [Myxacorys californica WJT36-NPBG1]
MLVNFAIASPSWAGKDFTKGADYAEVTQSINQLLQSKNTSEQLGYTQEELQQRLAELQLQQHIMQTATKRAQCRNETGHTLAVYANLPKKSPTSLYFLGSGKITDDDWDCDGVYLPSGTSVAISPNQSEQTLTAPSALKIVDGTHLVTRANPQTGAIEFNTFPAKTFQAGQVNWAIPNWSQTEIDAKPLSKEILD